MDALEYEKARIRMCRTMILKKGGCEACPLYDGLRHRCWLAASVKTNLDIDTIETHIDRVIKWAKEHPAKTRQSEFLKMFPKAETDKNEILIFCPRKFDPENINSVHCHRHGCLECRTNYWLTEVTDNE